VDGPASGVKIGSSEKDVLAAYGAPESMLLQSQAKMLVYDRRGVILWVMGGKVDDFTVIKQREHLAEHPLFGPFGRMEGGFPVGDG